MNTTTKSIILIAILFSIFFIGCSDKNDTTSTDPDPVPIEQIEINSFFDEFLSHMNNKDTYGLFNLYSDSYFHNGYDKSDLNSIWDIRILFVDIDADYFAIDVQPMVDGNLAECKIDLKYSRSGTHTMHLEPESDDDLCYLIKENDVWKFYGNQMDSTNRSARLIAHYPLSSNPDDITGNNPPMELINTPFQEGGIYCNGNYLHGDPDSCNAETPYIPNLDFYSFSITAYFKVEEYPPYNSFIPIFVGGHGWRWVRINLMEDGTLYGGETQCSLNSWHKATVTYDNYVRKIYLDDELATIYEYKIVHGHDRNVSITNFGSGVTFKGIFRDLKIYNGIIN